MKKIWHVQSRSKLCPLCGCPVDLRTAAKTSAANILGRRWHGRCLDGLVTAQALVKAQQMLLGAQPRPEDAGLMAIFPSPNGWSYAK